MSRGALAPAVRDFETALELTKILPAGIERDALELSLLTPLGTAYIGVRGYAAPEVGPVFNHARALCERIGAPHQLFAVVWGIFAWHVVRGEMNLSLHIAKELMALAEQLDDPGTWMEALFLVGVTQFYRGAFIDALAHYERGLSRYDDRERTRAWAAKVGEDAGVTHRCYAALTLWHLGYPDQARLAMSDALKLANAIEHPFSLAYAQHHAAWLNHRLGLPAETKAMSQEEMRTATDHGFPLFRATATIYHAAGLLLEKRALEALPEITNGLEAYRRTGAGMALPYYLATLGEAYGQLGRLDDAANALDEAIAIARRNDELCQLAELHRLKGEIAMLAADWDLAAGELDHSLAVAKSQASKAWELRAATSFFKLCRETGRAAQGRDRLADIFSWFSEGFETPDLKAAKSLLDAPRIA